MAWCLAKAQGTHWTGDWLSRVADLDAVTKLGIETGSSSL